MSNEASNAARDAVAEFVGNVFSGIVGGVASIGIGGGMAIFLIVVVVYGIWRLSLLFGPEKKCWWCHGRGQRNGLIGGVKTCSMCRGSGRIQRIGAGK